MSMKKMALIALASTALMAPAYASNAEIDQLTKEINALKAKVNELSKKSSAAPAAAPSAAPVVASVKACEAQGEGFFVIPGTSSCMRLSGYARTGGTYTELVGTDNTNKTKSPDSYEGRFRLNTDVRTSTDMGTLRGYARLHIDFASTSSTTSGDSAKVTPDLAYGYVSLGGWSMGRQDSAFLFYNRVDASFIPTDDNVAPVAVSYTLPVGAGLSATLAVENQFQRSATPEVAKLGSSAMPDVVAATQLVSGAATFKLAGALHQLQDGNSSDTKEGYALQGGLKYVVSPETTIWLQGAYARGAMSYLGYGITSTAAGSLGAGSEQSAASTSITADASPTLDLSSGWSALGAINQKIGNGNLALIGTYGNITNMANANNLGVGGVEGTVTQLEANYTFKPYAGVNFQPALAYQKWDLENADTGAALGASTDRYAVRLRAWREF